MVTYNSNIIGQAPVVKKPDKFIHWIVTIQSSQSILSDAFGETSAQANDSYTFIRSV